MSTPLELSLAEVAAAIAERRLSSREVTAASLDALHGTGAKLNAIVELWHEKALAAADAADELATSGATLAPLHGVPLAHKAMFDREGETAEYGSAIFAGERAGGTATVLKRLDAAGAIDIGRLNMVEIALGVTGHNPHTGHPKNAWDRARITGGSTSGGATSVAARLTYATLGSDTGGSIRIPSSLCNLVGIKPTYGRVSRAACMPLSFSLDHIGPLCRTTADCALMLEAIAGADPLDRTTSPRAVPSYSRAVHQDVVGTRITLARDYTNARFDQVVLDLERDAAEALRGLGCDVVERPIPAFEPLNTIRRAVMVGEAATFHRLAVRDRHEEFNQETLARLEPGFALSAVDYVGALAARGRLLRAFCGAVFADCDVLMLPTSPIRTPTIAETDTKGDASYVETANLLGGLVGPFNYLGLPALSVPMGFDDRDMPVGLQLVARPFDEARLLRVAHRFEKETGFTDRRPPTAGG